MISVCDNCKREYNDDDKYCRFCGAPVGTSDCIGVDFAVIYGPPTIERTHKCEKCGYTWDTTEMIDEQQFCPLCGGSAPVCIEEDIW